MLSIWKTQVFTLIKGWDVICRNPRNRVFEESGKE